METITVGATIITNFDMYWNYKNLIPKYEDMIARGFGIQGLTLDTPFAKSTKSDYVQSSEEYLIDIKEAVRIFEERYPKSIDCEFCKPAPISEGDFLKLIQDVIDRDILGNTKGREVFGFGKDPVSVIKSAPIITKGLETIKKP